MQSLIGRSNYSATEHLPKTTNSAANAE